MELTPFTVAIGARQGRMAPEAGARSGEFAFVLGNEEPGHIHRLDVGDHAEVRQSVDLTGVNFIRAFFRLANADAIPANMNWEVSLIVDGVKAVGFTVPRGRTRERSDLAANVSKLVGPHDIGVRLELVSE